MMDFIKRLIDKNDPLEMHIFLTLCAVITLCFLSLSLGIAIIFISKNLVAELTLVLTHLVGLTGLATYLNKRGQP